MSIEELLRPRYKVVAIWPDMGDYKYFHGQIIEMQDFDSNGQWYIKTKKSTLYDAFFDSYSNLFKKLNWWEERKPEDMPEYVKGTLGGEFKVMEFAILDNEFKKYHKTGYRYLTGTDTFPATKSDYETYLTTNKLNP